MGPDRLLHRITAGQVANVRFSDMARLLDRLGFELKRVSGSHHIFTKSGIPEIINLQKVDGEVKPYQVRQVANLIRQYNLGFEDSND